MSVLAPGLVTWSEAKATIIRPTGRGNDTDTNTAAYEILRDVLNKLALRDWGWLNMVTTVNCTTDGLLTLPTAFKKIYSVWITGLRNLEETDEREWLRFNPAQTPLGGTYIYIPYNHFETGKLQLRDAPGANVSVNVDYIRTINIPTIGATTATLNVPQLVESYVLAKGRARITADFGGSETALSFWMREADEIMTEMVVNERRKPNKRGEMKALAEERAGGADYEWGNHA